MVQTPLEQVIAALERERSRYRSYDGLKFIGRCLDIVHLYHEIENEWELKIYSDGFRDAVRIKDRDAVEKEKAAQQVTKGGKAGR
jgi:hypothetical protein